MKIELELVLHDMDSGPEPYPGAGNTIGHTWWSIPPSEQTCELCNLPATWSRDTDDHPNYIWSDLYCGMHASEILRKATNLETRVVIQGREFGYAWQAKITQDEEGANL